MRVSVIGSRCTRWGLTLAFCLGLASHLVAQDVPPAEIQIGDANGDALKQKIDHPWIGVAAGPVSDELRAHLDIPGNSGLVVRQVVPNSPAEKVGLQEYDVLIRADKNPLGAPADLVEIVQTWDQQTDGIKVEWLRRGKEMSEIITPADRPDDLAVQFGRIEGMQGLDREIEAIRKRFGKNGQAQMRFFGPGIQAGAHTVQSVEENGLKLRIERSNDDPAKVHVTKGDSEWDITEDQLDQLPDEIADRVKGMLKNSKVQIGVNGIGQIPNIQVPDIQMPQMPQFQEMQRQMQRNGFPRMQERFDEMEKQMQKMLEEIERLQPQLAPAENDGIDPDNEV